MLCKVVHNQDIVFIDVGQLTYVLKYNHLEVSGILYERSRRVIFQMQEIEMEIKWKKCMI